MKTRHNLLLTGLDSSVFTVSYGQGESTVTFDGAIGGSANFDPGRRRHVGPERLAYFFRRLPRQLRPRVGERSPAGQSRQRLRHAGRPEGATVNVSGTPFRISYVGGSGNDVVLTQLTATQRPLLNIQLDSLSATVVPSWPTTFTGCTREANTNGVF